MFCKALLGSILLQIKCLSRQLKSGVLAACRTLISSEAEYLPFLFVFFTFDFSVKQITVKIFLHLIISIERLFLYAYSELEANFYKCLHMVSDSFDTVSLANKLLELNLRPDDPQYDF